MNWYDATLIGVVERFDVEKTIRLALKSACVWTAPKLEAAIATMPDNEGMTNVRITAFTPMDAPANDRRLPEHFTKVVNVDSVLNI